MYIRHWMHIASDVETAEEAGKGVQSFYTTFLRVRNFFSNVQNLELEVHHFGKI